MKTALLILVLNSHGVRTGGVAGRCRRQERARQKNITSNTQSHQRNAWNRSGAASNDGTAKQQPQAGKARRCRDRRRSVAKPADATADGPHDEASVA